MSKVQIAIQELESYARFFQSMVDTCNLKCVSTKFTDGELTKGECVCLDRCAAKFVAASEKISAFMQSMENSAINP